MLNNLGKTAITFEDILGRQKTFYSFPESQQYPGPRYSGFGYTGSA